MSVGSRIAIGIVALVGAVSFLITAFDPGGLPGGALVFYGMAAVFAIVAIACFFPKTHPIREDQRQLSVFVRFQHIYRSIWKSI